MVDIYKRAQREDLQYEGCCSSLSRYELQRLMKDMKRADRRIVVKAAMKIGIVNEVDGKRELKQPYYNPYNHYRTDTHLIYVHSSIEYFIKVP